MWIIKDAVKFACETEDLFRSTAFLIFEKVRELVGENKYAFVLSLLFIINTPQ